MSGKPVDAFTISSNNYLGMARVFADSFLERHPGSKVYVCLVDRRDPRVAYDELPFEIVLAEELGIPHFEHFAFKYDILELNTAVKPFMFRYLRDQIGLDRAFYFDPDILVHDRLSALEESLAVHQAVLTPHLTEPLDNRCRPTERMIGMCGVYNLGFVGLQLNETTAGFIDWWCDRLHRYCVVDLANGIFVDQSWMDFAPSYLDSVAIVRDPIFNVAYWNLPHREPRLIGDHWEVGGRRVGFFHFSGVDLDNIDMVSRHQDRVDLWQRPELRPLFEHYRTLVERSGQRGFRTCKYHYAAFAGGAIAIPSVARNLLQEVDPDARRWPHPFATEEEDSYLTWLSEPVSFAGEVVNRAALGLWDERADITAEFSKPEDGDLGRYIDWYLGGGAGAAGLDDAFIEPLREERLARAPVWRDLELEEAATIDLRDPGECADWLNQRVVDGPGPVVTRLAMLIHRTRSDASSRFPDPFGRDRLDFAYWMALDGSREYGLHESLVRDIRRSLPLLNRIVLPLKLVMARRRDRSDERTPAPLPVPESGHTPPGPAPTQLAVSRSPLGVNLVGFFEGAEGARSFAPWIERALRAATVPCVTVSLDHWQPQDLTRDRFRHEAGFPYPVTLLVAEPAIWDALLRQVPLAARAGGRVIGYCQGAEDLGSVRSPGRVDEIWAPTPALRRRLMEVTNRPISCVRPPIPADAPPRAAAASATSEPNLTWFLAVDHGRANGHARATSAAIECVRRLTRKEGPTCGLYLLVSKERFDIARQVTHLPVRVEVMPDTDGGIDEALMTCSGFVDLRSEPHVDPVMVAAATRGLPVVSAWLEIENLVRGPEEVDGHPAAGVVHSVPGAIELVVDVMREVAAGSGPALERAVGLSSAIARTFRDPTEHGQLRDAIHRVNDGDSPHPPRGGVQEEGVAGAFDVATPERAAGASAKAGDSR